VIVLYPALLIAAIVLAVRTQREDGRGGRWFALWCVAGGLFLFSLLSGLSIGLFFLPAAAAALLFAASQAPHLAEGSGFLAGVGLVVVAVAALNGAAGWLVFGLALVAAAVGAFALARD
jgi:hypothetical protein